jgi:glycosyltransferase involved in cell wall biosynthesis
MNVLLLHNRYRSLGGEERAVREIAALLARHGHRVVLLERTSAELSRAGAARALLRGGEDAHEVTRMVQAHSIDVVHAHNLHPRLGWRALAAARAGGARTVLHLHNFRLFCSIGVAYRDGRPCHECRGRNTLPGLAHNCRGSRAESAVYAAALSAQQPPLLRHADRLVSLSHAHAALLRQHGLDRRRLDVIPNFVSAAAERSAADRGTHALVAGRLVPEKGFDTAIRAAAAAGVPLVVAGTGPDGPRLRQLAKGADVRFTGWLEPDALTDLRNRAAVVLAPSRCEEACPYSVLEALAAGVPVLVSDRGGLPELTDSANVLAAEDTGAWGAALGALWSDPERRRSRGEAALAAARRQFTADAVYPALMGAYGWDP